MAFSLQIHLSAIKEAKKYWSPSRWKFSLDFRPRRSSE